jgi:hypothetical protein
VINEKTLGNKLSRLDVEGQKKVYAYLACYRCVNEKLYLDPTNRFGNIDPSFEYNPSLYINEPDQDQEANCTSVINMDTKRMEIFTKKEIRKGEELLIAYGDSYSRDYSVNENEEAGSVVFQNGKLQFVQNGYTADPR